MTDREQLQKWVDGESIHNKEFDQCCPDFSCCISELLVKKDIREKFYNAYILGDNLSTDAYSSIFLTALLDNKSFLEMMEQKGVDVETVKKINYHIATENS